MTRVAVVTPEPVNERMAGPAIRAWNMADVLAEQNDVRLVSVNSVERESATFDVRGASEVSLADDVSWADVVIAHPGILRTHPAAGSAEVLVIDLYDPFHLENLEPGHGSFDARSSTIGHLNSVISDALKRGDYFLCASERQRDFWLGSLTALGRVNPATYDDDPNLTRLVGVAPFGIPSSPPQHHQPVLRNVLDGIGRDDRILIWAGGVYDWFDPITLVDAVARAAVDVTNLRLFFLGMSHPNPAVPKMRVADELRVRARALGLVDSHVFFNETWVPYDERSSYLLESDAGVSTHRNHIETRFSFRTRMLDYIWAGLPYITTEGDTFADLAERADVGVAVPPNDVAALADAIMTMLDDEPGIARRRANAAKLAPAFHWPRVLADLSAFCSAPRRAPDRQPSQPSPAEPPARQRQRWRRQR